MKLSYYIHILLLVLFVGCGVKTNNTRSQDKTPIPYSGDNEAKENRRNDINDDDRTFEDDENSEKYPDDTYCADVEYYNPNTGTSSSYTLTVEVESSEVTQINWPNGGWLDEDHFSGADLDDDGSASFTSDKGYEYEIQITGKSRNCFVNVPRARQCIGMTRIGSQCRNMTDNPNRLCWKHQGQDTDDSENLTEEPEEEAQEETDENN